MGCRHNLELIETLNSGHYNAKLINAYGSEHYAANNTRVTGHYDSIDDLKTS